ncbi:MAG TPA: glutathione S-transferase [Sphingomonas sp.]
MIIVHHHDNSRSQRVLWLLEELGLPYEVKLYRRNPKTMLAPPELKRVHPLGKAPIVEDDGIVLVETGAIVEHLVRKGAGVGGPDLGPPGDLPGMLLWRQFLHYAEGSLMPPLLALLVVGRLGLLGRPARKPLLAMFATHLRWLEDSLATRDWFTGDHFTAADVMMSFPLEAATGRAGLDGRYPRLLAWLGRIHARPAYKAALARGGPYALG